MGELALQRLPAAVIGAGPIGLAAAAHLIARGLPVKVYEAGPAIGRNVRDWGHVRLFTPWRYCVDQAARELRLDLDPRLESAKALGPLIDPNVHSCGSVPPPCGDPTPAKVEACCVADAVAKSAGKPGCGCGAAA